MSLNKGQRVALYALLSTHSQLRYALEGRLGPEHGSAKPNPPAPQDYIELNKRLDYQLNKRFGGASTGDLKNSDKLWDAGGINNVTADDDTIREVLGMGAFYDPNSDPCPSDYGTDPHSGRQTNPQDQEHFIAGVVAQVGP